MLSYPSIPRWKESKGLGKPCIAFDKYDGSNLRWEWTPKRKWHKFGTRTQLFDESHEVFGCAVPLFQYALAKDIEERMIDYIGYKPERLVVFTEFFGKNSFAGTHDPLDAKELVLFDVSIYKKGFMAAREFVKVFGDVNYSAKVIYDGNMNTSFIQQIQNSDLNEGVICKGIDWSAKIKTFKYLDRLKNKYGDEWEKYGE